MNIRNQREKIGYSIHELAKLVGISPHYLVKLENGQRTNPNIDIMRSLSRVLQVTVEELFFYRKEK